MSIYIYVEETNTTIEVSDVVAMGNGDMLKATYDPTSVEGDAFDMDNMVESATSKIMTSNERTSIASALQPGDNISELTNDSGFITTYTETDPVFITHPAYNVTAQNITDLGNLSGTNTGDQDLSGLVPYTGATTDLDMGAHNIILPVGSKLQLGSAVGEALWSNANGDVALESRTQIRIYADTNNAGNPFEIYNGLGVGDVGDPAFIVKDNEVGINNINPSARLHVGAGYNSLSAISPTAIIYEDDNSIKSLHLENANSGSTAEMRFVTRADNGDYMAFSTPSSGNINTLFGDTRNLGSFVFTNGRPLYLGTVGVHDVKIGTGNATPQLNLKASNTSVGIGTENPTEKLTVNGNTTVSGNINSDSTVKVSNSGKASGFQVFNTVDETTNLEVGYMRWTSDYLEVGTGADGTGTNREARFGVDSGSGTGLNRYLGVTSAGDSFFSYAFGTTGLNNYVMAVGAGGNQISSTGVQGALNLNPVIAQSGTAGYTLLGGDITETTVGSGTYQLMDLQIDSVTKFAMDWDGNITTVGTISGVDITDIDISYLSATGTADSTTFLRGDGTWSVPAGSGDVSKVGTPVDNQVGVWTGDGTIEGTSGFTYDGTTLDLTGNITVTGTVDGRDIATDGSTQDSHIADSTIHFTQASINITASQVSDFDTEVANNTAVTANTAKVGVTTQISNVVEDTTPQLGGDLDAQDNNITGVGAIQFTQELSNGSKTASFSVDFSTDQKQSVTLTANTMTLTLDTTSIGVGNYTLRIVNGGLATLTWAAETGSIKWAGGTAPTLTSSGEDIVTFYYNGTDFYGVASLDFS